MIAFNIWDVDVAKFQITPKVTKWLGTLFFPFLFCKTEATSNRTNLFSIVTFLDLLVV